MGEQDLTCPDCGGDTFKAVVLAVVGPKDTLGLRCEECDRGLAKVDVSDARRKVREAIAEVHGE